MGFAKTSPKSRKRHLGRTDAARTPVAIRSKVKLPDGFGQTVRDRMAAQVGYAGSLFERGSVRFEDVNGPRGGTDTVCRIKLVLSGRPSIHIEKRAATIEEAFAATVHALKTAVQRTAGKHGLRAGRSAGATTPARPTGTTMDDGEIIGRRVGRGRGALERALERPEKARRDAYVDTSAKGVSATARRAGGHTTARRNSRARLDRATVILEDSRTKPSRKSTRRSSRGGKPSHGKEQTAGARVTSSSATAARALARRRRRDRI